jgi:TolB protein
MATARVCAVTLAVALVGVAASVDTAGATWSGGVGRIAFDSDVSGTSLQIYTMRPDGSDRRQLTRDGDSGDPSWSPDGRWLAFDSDRDAPSRIYVMDGAGGHVRDVNPDGNCSAYPSWSPNGREIVFSHYPDPECAGSPDIWIESADGTHARPLTRTTAHRELKPVFAPDGSRIAFISHLSRPETFTVDTIRPDGRDRRSITPAALDATYPDWSPDSRWLVVSSNSDRDNSNLYLVRPDGSGLRQLTHQTTGDATKAVWSPTGRSIVYSTNATTDDFELVVLSLRTSRTRRLTNTPEGGEYFSTWQPRVPHCWDDRDGLGPPPASGGGRTDAFLRRRALLER